ncbi:MAG: 3-hydroxyacyl-ACP dehydratase FabZ [bacterium]
MIDREIATLNIYELLNILPHRYPFLLVDKIIEYEKGKRVKGVKNVTINEPYFPGHFPELPITPGVIIIEAMAQIAGILLLEEAKEKSQLAILSGVDKVRFRRMVRPGDQIVIEAELLQKKINFCKLKCTAYVDNYVVAEGELMIALYKEDYIRDIYTSNSDNR